MVTSGVYRIIEKEQEMGYCAICGRTHDPDVYCLDGTRQVMRETDSDERLRGRDQHFRLVASRADKWFMKLLLIILGLLAILTILSSFIRN